jgi:hypothetical protein
MNKPYVRILCSNQVIYGKMFTNKKAIYFWGIPIGFPIDKFLKYGRLNFKKFYE